MSSALIKLWSVVSALIEQDDRLLLVANRRRGGYLEWTPPGGVVDSGESGTLALRREVAEEVGLIIDLSPSAIYGVSVNFPDQDMVLRVEVFRATSWFGSLVFDDPDGIVEDGRFVDAEEGRQLLQTAPRWVAEPVNAWLSNEVGNGEKFDYVASGVNKHKMVVQRL